MRLAPLALSAACLIALPAAAQEAGPYKVERTLVDDRKAVIATISSVRDIQARARIGGTIGALFVKEGDRVAAGQTLAVIGDPKLAIRGKGLEAGVQAAQAALDKAKIDAARAKELRASGYGTQARLDEANTALQVAQNALASAMAGRQEVAQQSSEGAVLAPAAGRVLKVPVSVGSVVMPGELIASLSQENYILRLQLPERHARFLKAGDSVQIGARGLQEEESETLQDGTVRLVYPEIKEGRVIADVVASDLGDYFVGERTRVYVSTGQRAAFLLPSRLIFQRAGISLVKLKGGEEVVVQKGQVLGPRTEILAGLHEGDEVIAP